MLNIEIVTHISVSGNMAIMVIHTLIHESYILDSNDEGSC